MREPALCSLSFYEHIIGNMSECRYALVWFVFRRYVENETPLCGNVRITAVGAFDVQHYLQLHSILG